MNIFDSNGENNIPALNQKENQDINLNLIQNSNTSKDDIDYLLAFQMQPLPIDQRYGKEEIQRIIDVIKSYSK